MCFDNLPNGRHECIDPCPVCYLFTISNTRLLLRSDTIALGTFELFSEVARVGCRLCAMLCRIWESNDSGFKRDAQVRVFIPKEMLKGKIWTLYFEIDQPGFNGELFGEETGGYLREEKRSSWAVPIGVFTKGTKYLDHVFPVRAPSPSVSHDDVFEQFKRSLEICLAEHTSCAKSMPRLPTRILAFDDADTPERVFLHESEPEEIGQYIALSYCWGKTVQTKLLTSSIESFKKTGIVIDTLPQTLQDAILATRKLGMKYLWIDSLCIIQDSATDKDAEIAGMASIYKNAILVISAAVSSDCGDGFLQDRGAVQSRLNNSLRLPFFTEADPEARAIVDWIHLCPDPHMGFKVLRFAQEPINSRAWTYQESKLAERLLIFGSGPPQWHCKEAEMIYGLDLALDDLPDPNGYTMTTRRTVEDGETTGGETRTTQEKVPTEDIGAWKEWFPMLENYSHKALTVRTDKLLAIAAMAAEYASEENGAYAAGLWENSLPRSLLWRRDSPPDLEGAPLEYEHSLSWLQTRIFDAPIAKHEIETASWESKYIAPTWSPMSCTESIYFEEAATPKLEELVSDLLYSSVIVHDIHVFPTASINPYGRLDFAYLDISAPMWKISWTELTANYIVLHAGEPSPYWDYVVADDPSYFAYMVEKHGSSLSPQILAGEIVQHTLDSGDALVFAGEKTVGMSEPSKEEEVPHEVVDFKEPLKPSEDIKHDLLDAIAQAQLSCDQGLEDGMSNLGLKRDEQPASHGDECAFWLLEVERSVSPSGLVLKAVRDNIFARVGYFGKNDALHSEIVDRQPDMPETRGFKSRYGERPRGPSGWCESLTRRRIYLV